MLKQDIVGHLVAKRALEVAAAGGHSIMLYGPRNTGKSALAAAYVEAQAIVRDTCACGNHRSVQHECLCEPRLLSRWIRRTRIDMYACDIVVEVEHRPAKELLAPVRDARADELFAARVAAAVAFGKDHTSLDLGSADSAGNRTLEMATRRLGLTFGQLEAVKRVARTIANLSRSKSIEARHIAEAVQWHDKKKRHWQALFY